MAAYTPPKSGWVIIGSGISEFKSEHNEPRDGDSLRLWAGLDTHQLSTPPNSLGQYSNGLTMPSPSEEKNIQTVPCQSSKLSHHEYYYKLREPDSKGRQLHRLVVRWWDADSRGVNSATQLRAGLYKNTKLAIPPPFCETKLQDAFRSHLTPELKDSPFISVFESFLPALHRALKSRKDAYLSIIDLHQVEKDSRKRFPKAVEVVWPIKVIIKKYGFKLRNHYKGNEWLVHGAIEKSAIVQTVKVSDLLDFGRTGRIRHMRDVLSFISQQQHAFGLIDSLPVTHPKTSYRTGQLVGRVLDHVQIPAGYKAVLARKIRNVMHFEHSLSQPRERAYLKGVYNFDHPDSDSDSDGLDDFLVDSDEEYNSDGTFWDDSDLDDLSRMKQNIAVRDSASSMDQSEAKDSSESEEEDEQALVDAQIHATEKEWIVMAPEAPRKMLRISHIKPPKPTAEQRAEYKLVKASTGAPTVDLTNDTDDERDRDEDVIEVQPWTNEQEIMIIATVKGAGRQMNLAVRSTSMRSSAGPGGGLAQLEADARLDVMEVMQFD